MEFWAGLYNPELQSALVDDVKIIMSCAHRVLSQQARPTVIRRLQASSHNRGTSEAHASDAHPPSADEEASD